MRMRGAAIVVLAMVTCAEARCGISGGDDASVARAVDAVAAMCPCGSEWRSCMRRHVRAAAARIGLPKRCRAKAKRAIRRRGCVSTSSSTSTAASTSTTSTTALRKGLPGRWRLEGHVIENRCNEDPDFDTTIEIQPSEYPWPTFGLRAAGDRRAYLGGWDDQGWWLTSEWIGLFGCPTGEAGEPYWGLAGPVPEAETEIPVTATLYWVPPTQPYAPCPQCTVRWEGTMRRE
jgi:hypothetical protein